MVLLTVEGFYKNCKIELTECPSHVDESARVLVTVLPKSSSPQKTDESQDRETLRQQAFARMKEGIHLGGPPYPMSLAPRRDEATRIKTTRLTTSSRRPRSRSRWPTRSSSRSTEYRRRA